MKLNMLNEYQTQTELNPKLWDGDELKPKLRLGLLKIARAFYKSLGIDANIKDITLTGSNANYNWSRHSDLDLHLIINYKDINDNEILVKELMNAKKSLWNNKYPLKYKGMNIELYAQDTNEPHASTGVYSIFNNDWVNKPDSQMVSVDDHAIKRKAEPFKYEIDNLKLDDPKLLKKIASLKQRLKKLRKAGLDSVGEYSLENLAYKDLRNAGHLQRLNDLQDEGTFGQLQIESSLPVKLKDIQKVKNITLAPDATEVEKDMWNHHHVHPGTADSMAEPDTYDFDDDTESDPGIQYDDKNDEIGGYEPIDEAKKKKSKIDMMLPRGKQKVLKAEDKDYDRGLLVKLLDNGGYEMAYWYDKPNKPYPVEIIVDGKSIKADGKVVKMKFHPKDYYEKQDKDKK